MAHLGYLHCIQTFSMCCYSLESNCFVDHMVLALCVRVLITVFWCKIVVTIPLEV